MEPGQRDVVREVDVPIEGASPGDAFTEYCLACQSALLRRMRSQLDETDAEDVVQAIFLQAWRDIGRYDSRRASAQTWLYRLADQALAMHLRSRARRLRAEQESVAQEDPLPGLDPAEREEARRLLEHLGPVSHRIMAARYLLGFSTEEIARSWG